MVLFTCKYCNYDTTIKSNYNKHLKTKKHHLNYKTHADNLEEFPPLSENEPKRAKNEPKRAKMSQNEPKKKHQCEFCYKTFATIANKRRHELHRCKAKMTDTLSVIKKQETQIKKLEKQIELLLTKVGHNFTTITNNTNTNNNIQLNNYGNEDLSHITDTLKTHLLKQPYGAIQHLIEKIHFNEDKPENTNIMITNKRDNKISVFENGKWVYRNKKKTILGLIDNKYYLLDDHYNDIPFESLSTFNHDNYKRFSGKYDTCEKELLEKLYEDAEIIILNQK